MLDVRGVVEMLGVGQHNAFCRPRTRLRRKERVQLEVNGVRDITREHPPLKKRMCGKYIDGRKEQEVWSHKFRLSRSSILFGMLTVIDG